MILRPACWRARRERPRGRTTAKSESRRRPAAAAPRSDAMVSRAHHHAHGRQGQVSLRWALCTTSANPSCKVRSLPPFGVARRRRVTGFGASPAPSRAGAQNSVRERMRRPQRSLRGASHSSGFEKPAPLERTPAAAAVKPLSPRSRSDPAGSASERRPPRLRSSPSRAGRCCSARLPEWSPRRQAERCGAGRARPSDAPGR